MPSFIERVNNINAPAQKVAYSSGLGSLFSVFGSASNRDLAADEFGAAQAYVVMTGVQRGVAFWQKQLGGLVWHLYDGRTNKIITSSTDRKLPTGPGEMFVRALQRFPQQSKHGFFESIAFSDKLYGETYILRLVNNVAHSDFMWANPLAIEPDIREGEIVAYRYQPAGYQLLALKDVAFRIAHRNPLDDLRGQSAILSAIDEINIVRNVKRALRSYYRKGMILGGVVSPDSEMDMTGEPIKELRTEMNRRNRGVDNAFGWFFSDTRVKFDQFEPVDIEKNYSIVEPLRNEIMMALGVPPVLAGDPTQVNYDNADKVMLNWWKTEGIPYARNIATDFVNGQLLPAIEPDSDIYFGFDLSPFEVQEPEVITADVNAGYVSLGTAQGKRGYEVDDDLRDIYVIAGRPMHKDIIVQVANQSPELVVDTPPPPPAEDTVADEPDAQRSAIDHALEHIETWRGGWTIDKARQELAVWQRKFKAGHEPTFTPEYTHGDLADMVMTAYADGADIKATFDAAFDSVPSDGLGTLKSAFAGFIDALRSNDAEAATKSLQSVRLDFEGAFADALAAIRTGDITDRRRAGTLLKQVLDTFGDEAFRQGLKDTGVDDAPDADDQAVINALLKEQSPHISKLTDLLINKDGITDAQAEQKLTLWFNGSVMPFYYAGIESGNQNALFQFMGRITKTSCRTCKFLWGQRHRYKDWKRAGLRPRVDVNNFICTARNCEHRLVPTQGKPRGHLARVPRPSAA